MNYLKLFNENIMYFYLDLNSNIQQNYQLYVILDKIKKDTLYFITLFKNEILLYKNQIISNNIDIIKNINDKFIYYYNLETIYNNCSKNKQDIIWNYLKIFIILCEKYFFTL